MLDSVAENHGSRFEGRAVLTFLRCAATALEPAWTRSMSTEIYDCNYSLSAA